VGGIAPTAEMWPPKEVTMGAIMVGTCTSDLAGNINARSRGQIGQIW
jgi:hypothetical protein